MLATLGVGAQTNDGGGDASTPQGRIIARVQDRTDDGGVDNYRIEFGFFPQWALDDKDPWSEAIDRWSDWLPRSRFLTKTVIDGRDADDNRRWLRSSLISVPAGPNTPQDGGADDGFAGDETVSTNLIEGRVIARYNPDSRGRLRVEFGFLPECAFTSTANTQEAVARYGEQFLPRARYLTASLIENRRGDWLRSSPVQIDSCEGPVIIDITRTTLEFGQDEDVESTRIGRVTGQLTTGLDPITVTDAPQGLTIELDAQQRLILSGTVDANAELGAHLVRITASPATGDPISETITIRITKRLTGEPVVTWRGYRTNEMAVLGDDSPRIVAPSATVDGDFVDLDYTYKVDEAAEDVCDVNRNDGVITPLRAGTCVIIATSVETDEYAADESDPVRVTITRVSPELRWDGYDEEDLREGGDPVRPSEPQPRLSEARGELAYTYSATPSSICAVNPRTGELTPHHEGDCDVTVRSAETDKFLADEVTITVSIVGNLPPECDRIPTVGPLDGGETDTINLDNYCRDPEGEDLSYSDAQSDDRAVVTVRLIGSSLTVTAAQTPAGDRARVTFTAADPARNEIEARFTVLVEEIQPPEVRSITCSPQEPDVGDRVECTADIQDGEPDPGGWDWRGGDPGNGPSNTDTYRTTFSEAGDQPVDLTVRNAAGSDSGSTTVRVRQEAPQIIRISCSPSSPDKREQVSCEALLRGGDPDRDGWDWRGGDSDGDREVYNTSFGTSGRKTISLTVSNSAGSDSDDRDVTVINRRPGRVGSIADVTVDVDGSEPVGVSGNFRDPDGDRLTYAADSDNSAVEASVSGATVTVTGSREGSATITVTADDGDGGTATQTFRVTVNENQAPECLSISGLSPIVLGGRGSARFRCSDPDGSPESISVTVASDDSSVVEASLAIGDGVVQIIGTLRSTRLNFRGLDEGSTTIRATATDAEGASTTIAFSVTVTAPPDDDPEINSISCTPSTVATSTSVTCTATVSGTEPLTYSWSGGDSSGSSSSYSPSWSSAGSKTVSLTVRNSAGSDSDSTSVTVMIPPSISSLGCPSSATVNQAISCSPTVTGTGPLTYSWSGGDSDSGQSGSTYSPSWSSAGSETVSLTVRNSAGSDDNRTEVTITGGGNHAPTCTVADELGREVTSVEVETFSGTRVVATCTDPDEDELTLTPTSANTNTARITASPGRAGNNFTIQGQGAQGDLGTTTVTISATDPGGLTGSVSISVTVRSTPPTMQGVASASVNVGGSVKVTQLSWDPDGDRFTATATSSNTNVARVSVDGTDFGTRTPPGHTALFSGLTTLTVTGVGVGTATITVRTTDVHGSGWPVGSGIRFDVTVQAAPPVVDAPEVNSISCTPSPVATNASVTCTVSLSDSGGTPDSYSWSGGSSSGSSSSYSPSWSSAGSKTVSLTVSNSGGSDSGSTTVVVMDPPSVSNVRCSPSSTQTNSSVSCSADVTGSTPLTYSWSGGDSRGSSSSYSPSWSSAGSKTVSLTVRNAVGSDSSAISGNITVTPEPPRSIRIRCTAYVLQGNSASCSVSRNRGGPISTHSWSGGDSSGSNSTYSPSWSSYGRKTVSLTASNAGGSDTDSLPVDVVASTTYTYARCGSDTIKVYYFETATLTKRHLNMTWEEVAARVPGWGEHMIGHLSQSACNSWPTGTDVTTGNW